MRTFRVFLPLENLPHETSSLIRAITFNRDDWIVSKKIVLRAIAMPVFANAHGDIFGGWLLSQMDLAGSAVAVRRANGRVVTVAVTAMSFQRPVFVGDEVSCYAKILKVGRTSITVKVEAFARRGRSGKQIQVTEGVFTYVAVDAESKPRPV